MNYSPIIIALRPPAPRYPGGYIWTIEMKNAGFRQQMKPPFESLVECLTDASDELSALLESSPEAFKDYAQLMPDRPIV